MPIQFAVKQALGKYLLLMNVFEVLMVLRQQLAIKELVRHFDKIDLGHLLFPVYVDAFVIEPIVRKFYFVL